MDNSEHPRPRRSLRWMVLLAVMAGSVAALWWPRNTVVRAVAQPSQLSYPDGSQHFAVLRHVRAPVAAVGLSDEHFEVVLGRDPGGEYGHRVRLDATGVDAADLSVAWTPEGAWLDYGSAHRVFVPASAFLGGR